MWAPEQGKIDRCENAREQHPNSEFNSPPAFPSHQNSPFNCETNTVGNYFCKHCHFNANLLIFLKQHFEKSHITNPKDEHLNRKHAIRDYVCKRCAFETSSSLAWLKHATIACKNHAKHFLVSRSGTLFFCSRCEFSSNWSSSVYRHIKEVHEGIKKWLQCDKCPYRTKDKRGISYHKLTHILKKTQWFDCEKCSYRTQSVRYLQQHHRFRHPADKWFECDKCPFKTQLSSCLKTHHSKKHTTEDEKIGWFACDQCPYKSPCKQVLTNHVIFKHTAADKITRVYQCEQCSYKANHRYMLRRHVVNKHTPDDEVTWHKCDKCDFKSKFENNLKGHKIRRHASEDEIQWFKCEKCPYKSNVKSYLDKHIMYKHTHQDRVTLHKCDQCDFSTKLKSTLKVHKIRKHLSDDEVKWYQCDKCPYKTKLLRVLNSHKKLVKHDEKAIEKRCSNKIQRHVSKKEASEDKTDYLQCKDCEFKTSLKKSLVVHRIREHLNRDEIQ